jgi:CRP/FNR family transcriptional regulator, cyclic AMP receptor protein
LKDDVTVAAASQPGVVFGEMAALLGTPHTATVRAVKPCAFYLVENARAFMESTPAVSLHICELLAGRLDSLNKYLVDVKHQFEGHDHLCMVDEVLEALASRLFADSTVGVLIENPDTNRKWKSFSQRLE